MNTNTTPPQSFKPPEHGLQHYKTLPRETTAQQLGAIIAAIAAPEVLTEAAFAETATPVTVRSSENEPTPQRQDYFTLTINATSEKGAPMDEQQFMIDMVFKPLVPNLKLRPEESQLLLAYIGDLLKEIEIEEQLIIEAEKAEQAQNGHHTSRGDLS